MMMQSRQEQRHLVVGSKEHELEEGQHQERQRMVVDVEAEELESQQDLRQACYLHLLDLAKKYATHRNVWHSEHDL